MNSKRPVNLDLSTIAFPLPALISITHRITGVALFVGVGLLLWGLDLSLASEESFNSLKECLDGVFAKLVLWAILSGLIFHLVAGIKHLGMDMGIGETLEGGRLGAKIVLVLSIVLIIAAGVWIW
ncbi:succinate dehydrogenase, cytochrome b556 subunit [Gammaproteobacteria bacterium 45_16_T64]|nr:succinate dehydrogenase, cytochrome b556 subunit [Gammaproteobacteria bacterium 45_16_T64]